jgi:serine/threonine protein kinase/tetratricopeptide (TPR) repeat protein
MARLSADRWRTLSPYLDQALEIPGSERAGWLAGISARDAALGADLRRLLTDHEAVHASQFLEGAMLPPRGASSASLAGQVLGAYKLVSLIGQGGAGSVWLAERCDGRFEGRAAVKLLNVAWLGRAAEERFRREGHILARVTHPNIAHLIDAGVSPAGQPYLILEHVDGAGIDTYCDERALWLDDRLRLFLDVLEAVAHAHANLIVHRDIKPANVLVSLDGKVKLLDFGIAKLVESQDEWSAVRSGESGALTRDGAAALTPEYAAPEQLTGAPITTATDVYALGVLLYVLLSGRHPAGSELRSPAALVRAIVETEPMRASDAVIDPREPEEARERHATRCGGSTPARLRRMLRGDLDTIVAKALKKNPADRYASVMALADDVRRYLRHEPIRARPDTMSYRTVRFAQRHARGLVMTAVVLALLGGSTAYYTARLATERDRAQREAVKAAKVSEVVTGLLTSADPYQIRTTQGEQTPRGLLDAAATQVQTELAGEPELQAQILTVMGRTYRRLGVFDRAQALLEQALDSGRRVLGPEHVRVAQTLHDLGVVRGDRGDYDAAARTLEEALAMRRKLLGPEHADVAVTLAELGRVYQDEGFNPRAEPLQREALRIRRKALGDEDRETAVSLSDLGSVLRLNGDLAGAETLLRQSLSVNLKTRGPDHPNTSATLHALALIAAARGDYRTAEADLRRVLDVDRRALGERHPVVAMTLNNLARTLSRQGRHAEAAMALQQALDIARATLGDAHQLVAIYTINLGAERLALHEPAAAEALLRDALAIRSRAPGIVPVRRRTFAEDDWSIAATKALLDSAVAAQAR